MQISFPKCPEKLKPELCLFVFHFFNQILIWWVGFLPLQNDYCHCETIFRIQANMKKKKLSCFEEQHFLPCLGVCNFMNRSFIFFRIIWSHISKKLQPEPKQIKANFAFCKTFEWEKMLNHSDVIKQAVIPSTLKANPCPAKVCSNFYLARLLVF